ncbi:hypothetical protein BS333_16995 [Vibrio azureus]|uniref:UPF0310 protein VAZ01S_085_00270 n=1 Tax=Vibrio azureus NBRC 104587 TaxID=1219077 RepID=U3AVB1_9VIBR|nr:EVE domain-containing protein [Vibrio azureus]AUI88069.1 hypothetical protein BS333_16995 [Vibrio azureus]GAD77680.1 hypothetical protein VAZ01S_085_00270 [Vibrio azureus NBRC 104587]
MRKFWCGVVSREHIKRGVAGGFCQVCHGKSAPLNRMSVGDGIVFYSPTHKFKGKERCQKFTAIGQVIGKGSYQFKMAPDFIPYRRDIEYISGHEVAIHPMLDQLEFTTGETNWRFKFRFGHFEISQSDFVTIGQHMVGSVTLSECFNLSDSTISTIPLHPYDLTLQQIRKYPFPGQRYLAFETISNVLCLTCCWVALLIICA